MDNLYSEIYEYITLIYKNNTLNKNDVHNYVKNYGNFIKTIVPENVPKSFHKYVNIPLIINDMYENHEILVFCFDLNDDNISLVSNSELEDKEGKEFINNVRFLDDVDVREQITANKYTGGYWDESIHWVVDLRRIISETCLEI
jgi:nitrous oxidase accessory protein NosD